jgi:GT2 family glycosyltransferase
VEEPDDLSRTVSRLHDRISLHIRSSMSLPRVQIVILNWNGFRDTIGCLASVFALDYPDFRVVVCDNGSSDGSLERIREWADRGETVTTQAGSHGLPSLPVRGAPIRYVEYDRAQAEHGGREGDDTPLVLIRTGGNLGFAGGNNVGLRYTSARGDSDYVWLLNNDTVVDRSALRELVQMAEAEPHCGAVGGTMFELREPERVQEMGGGTVSRWHGMVRVTGRGLPANAPRPERPRLDYVSGGCVLLRRELLTRVGLLDERFFLYAEDVDWGIRMRESGYTLGYAPRAHIWHKGSGAFERASPTNDYHNVRGSLLLIQKHYPARLPVALAYSVYRCLAPKLPRREWKRFAAVARSYRDVARELFASGVAG